jgi:hypothetical protein
VQAPPGRQNSLGVLARNNAKAKSADPNSFVDSSIVKELDQSGFIKLYE